MGIHQVLTAPGAPWQNAYAERFIGSVRHECLDDVFVFNESGLLRVLRGHRDYYERSRTHFALDKDAPIPRPIRSATVLWSPSLKSAASTTDTNAAPPED